MAVDIIARGMASNGGGSGVDQSYVDSQDSRTLASANAYSDSHDATTLESAKSYTNEVAIEYIGREQQVDFNATLSENVITAELDESVSDFTFTNNTGYLFHIYLPLVTLTGDLDNSYEIILKDKNSNTININCMFQKDITKTSTVGDLCQIQDYDIGIGYSWEFYGNYREITENGVLIREVYTDTVVRETNPSMTGQDLHMSIINNKLKVGTVVMCTTDYENNGTIFNTGHTYKITGTFANNELTLDYIDITPNNHINVKDYGATGDGTTDDTEAIKLAITKGKNIYFPEGKYLISDTLAVVNKELKGTKNSELIISTDKNLFDIGFNTTITDFAIKNTVDNYSHSVFEISSRTIGNESVNFANVEISNIKALYFDGQPTTSNGTFFLIYASKNNGENENNTVLGFWGINIHDITSFQYFKYFIRNYITTNDGAECWITGCKFENIISMRNNYFWFGKKNDDNFDANGYRDGDNIIFNNIQVQYDTMMKYPYFLTSGWKLINNCHIWDFPFNETTDKPYTFAQQTANTTQYPIFIKNETGTIEQYCDIINGSNETLALYSKFNFEPNILGRNNIANINAIFLNEQNSNIYYYLGEYHLQDSILLNLFINRDPSQNDVANTEYGLSIKLTRNAEDISFKVNLISGGVSYQDLPTLYYKLVTKNNLQYVEFYMSKWGGNGNCTLLSNAFSIINLEDNNRVVPITPKELSVAPEDLIEINIGTLSNKTCVSENISSQNTGANFGCIASEQSTKTLQFYGHYGWKKIQLNDSGTTRPEEMLQIGQQYFDTTINKLIIWNGTSWVDCNGEAIG